MRREKLYTLTKHLFSGSVKFFSTHPVLQENNSNLLIDFSTIIFFHHAIQISLGSSNFKDSKDIVSSGNEAADFILDKF